MILEECKDARVIPSEIGFRKFNDDFWVIFFWQMNMMFQSVGKDLTNNMNMGLNALRCGIQFMPNTTWYYIASAYWFFSNFDNDTIVTDLLDKHYPISALAKLTLRLWPRP